MINGKVYDGGFMSMAQMDQAIGEAMSRGK